MFNFTKNPALLYKKPQIFDKLLTTLDNSSHPFAQMFYEIDVLKNFEKTWKNTCAGIFVLINL